MQRAMHTTGGDGRVRVKGETHVLEYVRLDGWGVRARAPGGMGGGGGACIPASRVGSWTRCAPEMISSPRMKTSKELETVGSSGAGIV